LKGKNCLQGGRDPVTPGNGKVWIMTRHQNHGVASERPHSLPVHFEFTDPDAGCVYIAGTFNNWQPDARPMHRVGNNCWVMYVMLPHGTHEYCFVVDGEFRSDPMVPENVPNPFGGRNSILQVGNELELLRYATAEELQQIGRSK
jgi:hypothetical protein